MKTILLILFYLFIFNVTFSQNFVLETKGQVSSNGKVLKKGDQISNKQKLSFGPKSEVRLLTPKGFFIVQSNTPRAGSSELGDLISEMVVSVSQKNLNTRRFDEMTDAQIETELSNVLEVLDVNEANYEENYANYIEPYIQNRYDNKEAQKVLGILRKKQKKDPPRPMGLLTNEAIYLNVPQATRLTKRSYSTLPIEFSLKKYCPTPKLQQYSDCVGWATTYAARTLMFAIQNEVTDKFKITEEAFAPSFTYGQIKLNPADNVCSQGTYIESGIKLLKNTGSIKFKDFEYGCSPVINTQDFNKASVHKIKNYKRLTEGSNPDKKLMVEAIKKSISEKRPVVIALEVYESFQNPDGVGPTADLWTGKKDKKLGKHAIVVVGYDDKKYGGAFELMNSWGTYWGNQGFIWIKYADFAEVTHEAYEMIEAEQSSPKPQPNVKKSDLAGSFKIVLEDGGEMPLKLGSSATRDFAMIQAEKSTYSANKPYASGTQFRLNFSNQQPAYVYMISFGSSTKNANTIFPFEGFSPYLDYAQNEVTIPNEDYWVQMDNNTGTDYLCILYSKEELDIQSINNQIQERTGGFNNRLKSVLKDKIVDGANINFNSDKVSFEAQTKGKTIIPITIEVKHID
jgi:uncharacterized protein YvpB